VGTAGFEPATPRL